MRSPVLSAAPVLPLVLGAVAVAVGESLESRYPEQRKLRIDSSVEFTLETTDSAFERDGEPMENRFGGGGMSTEGSRRVVTVDTVLESEEGAPRKVRRVFERVEGGSTMFFGENERDTDLESPLLDLALELTLDDGEISVEVVEGSEPSRSESLEGHRLELAFDALLPEGEVDEGDSWELEPAAVARALGTDLESALFTRPERGEDGGGGGGGRRGRGGRGGGGSVPGVLAQAEWDARATFTDEVVDHEGVACRVIEVAFEADGELPEPERGGGGRRGRALGEELPAGAEVVETTFEVELEGRLLFSLEEQRPVHFEVEGSISIESEREMERQDSTIRIYNLQEGVYVQRVSITPVTE